MNTEDVKRVEEILNADIKEMPKGKINSIYKELIEMINLVRITPDHELRFHGLWWKYKAMLEKKSEMLLALKK